MMPYKLSIFLLAFFVSVTSFCQDSLSGTYNIVGGRDHSRSYYNKWLTSDYVIEMDSLFELKKEINQKILNKIDSIENHYNITRYVKNIYVNILYDELDFGMDHLLKNKNLRSDFYDFIAKSKINRREFDRVEISKALIAKKLLYSKLLEDCNFFEVDLPYNLYEGLSEEKKEKDRKSYREKLVTEVSNILKPYQEELKSMKRFTMNDCLESNINTILKSIALRLVND